ncbi:hypothetical protein BBO99_00004953 [Phytophthora kernoviae]|uniref:Uncharacterized protein n=2 Tax=Phytophthora kernoviae TaxID=325452 RepID=A0A3R7J4B0_9STRA|nr:hypothetical protein G195_005412 [Phytophthora kernoviae 00238/432]KAG2525387.1 hypothetical protein JM16_004470 [Phytophthora kernoviae]KAG2527210.1 hypothetical protein JM18_003969 [Phytophthora kernoviae]RLM97615.1 hypothetical protein BBI17_004977 [Phytophthora kernoviae]RLN79879.1 hypothetical protein BBO99_00004953 [Phytophthora kernoviae]
MAGLRSVAVQSTHIHHVQLLSGPTTSTPKVKPSSESTNNNTSLHARLQRQCRANAWLLLTLGFICCLSKLGSATAVSTTDKTKSDVHLDSQRDLYIVLVSIPVLDKMLPLKHLAEELLSRGCRVGFALPENYRQWVSDLEGLEFISLGNIAGKGRAAYLEPNELQTLGVLAAGIYPGTIFQLYYARKIVVEATTSVMERCLNSYYRLRFRLELVSVYKEINAVRHEHGLEAIDNKHQMHGHALVLVNSVFGLDEARPMAPQFHMMNALETVDARLLWKISLQEQAAFDLRSRSRDSVLFLGDGVDDAAVLALAPAIELLINAGDFQSMQEALVVGVPILAIPFSAEQVEGVNSVVRAGAGLRLDGKAFTESTLHLAVDRILVGERERFQRSAEHLGELIKTGGGVKRAVDEVLAVAEFGSSHLLPKRNLQPLYKTYLVDVYLIYGAILCGAAIILRTFVSVMLSVFQPLTPVELALAAEEIGASPEEVQESHTALSDSCGGTVARR